MSDLFKSVKGLHPRKNAFNKSYRNTFTANLGQLVPVYLENVVPGEKLKVNTAALIRFQALLSPIMDNVNAYVHFWAVPYRLIDENFTKFIGGELQSDADYNPPYLDKNFMDYLDQVYGHEEALIMTGDGSLFDMLGYPKEILQSYNHTLKLNIRPLQAYCLLLKHWYLNENIVPQYFIEKIDELLAAEGDCHEEVSAILYHLKQFNNKCFFNHAWAKDYFTSSLPNVQSGAPVSLPLGGTAPVNIPNQGIWITPTNGNRAVQVQTNPVGVEGPISVDGTSIVVHNSQGEADVNRIAGVTSILTGTADLTQATAVTINELRVANALQVFRERIMRFGKRYIEYLRGFFNVISDDARLQIPEWLGGGKIPVNIAEVAQTSATENSSTTGANSPLATLAGKGTGFGSFVGFQHYFKEECLVLGLMYVQPKASYCQGVSRFLTKLNDRYDYFNPSFEHLGEQAIHKYELFSTATGDFGYTPRYSEYRVHNDETHGEFKSSLAYWTLTRIFSGAPSLNASFIYTQSETFNRIFAVANTPNLLVDMYFDVKSLAPMSKFGTPMLLS